MTAVDPTWSVPENYDVTERAIALPPPSGHAPITPMLAILSVRAMEDQATGSGLFSLFAWQRMAGHDALHTIEPLATGTELGGLEMLILGHAYAATGLGDAFKIAQTARKLLKTPASGNSVDAGLLLAVTAIPHGVDRVKTLLDMLVPDLAHGTDEHRATHALIRAAIDPDPAKLDEAHTNLAVLDDHFGLAQCALVAHAHEVAGQKRPELLRAYLEHATYRLEADGRSEWAARTLSHGLVPLLVETKAPMQDVAEVLGRAAALAERAKSHLALEAVFRTAHKHGYVATLSQLSQFEPPVFTRKDAKPTLVAVPTPTPTPTPTPAPASSPAPEAAPEAPKKKGGGKKKKSA